MSELGFHNSDVDFYGLNLLSAFSIHSNWNILSESIEIHVRIMKTQLRHLKSISWPVNNKNPLETIVIPLLLANSQISKSVGHRNLSIRDQ